MFGYHLYAHASVLTIHCKLLLAAIDIIDSFNWKCRLTQADLYNGCIKMVGWLWNYSNLYWGPFFVDHTTHHVSHCEKLSEMAHLYNTLFHSNNTEYRCIKYVSRNWQQRHHTAQNSMAVSQQCHVIHHTIWQSFASPYMNRSMPIFV